MEDERIVELYLAKDQNAIVYTASKYGAKLKRIANRIVNNDQEAEECENDTYLQAWNLIPPNEPRNYLLAFLGKIVRNIALDVCRRNNRQKRSAVYCELTDEMQECLPSTETTESVAEANYLGELINQFLESYNDEQQKMFVRRYWFFDSVSDIADVYGFSQSKVKTTLFRMREELKVFLEKGGYAL